mmetsp:Transcript_19633/g.51066  ORF Transcript_19633/g.51066 Transcript_19633/m.51066 type:complete len:203 (-) Transcript_19633:540-1148(-)
MRIVHDVVPPQVLLPPEEHVVLVVLHPDRRVLCALAVPGLVPLLELVNADAFGDVLPCREREPDRLAQHGQRVHHGTVVAQLGDDQFLVRRLCELVHLCDKRLNGFAVDLGLRGDPRLSAPPTGLIVDRERPNKGRRVIFHDVLCLGREPVAARLLLCDRPPPLDLLVNLLLLLGRGLVAPFAPQERVHLGVQSAIGVRGQR